MHEAYHQGKRDKGKEGHFTLLDICRYKSLSKDFAKVSLVFFIIMMLNFAPVVLIQKLIPNIFISGFANGITQLLTIPFMPYLNKNVSRRKGLMTMFGFATFSTLAMYFINPTGCMSCLKGTQYILLMVFFTMNRFCVNIASNFNFNVLNETYPSQVRSVCYCGTVSIGRFSNVFILLTPLLTSTFGIPYNIFYTIGGVVGVIAAFMIKETINIPLPEIVEELRYLEDEKEAVNIEDKC